MGKGLVLQLCQRDLVKVLANETKKRSGVVGQFVVVIGIKYIYLCLCLPVTITMLPFAYLFTL